MAGRRDPRAPPGKQASLDAPFTPIHTRASTDSRLLQAWLSTYADGSPHTLRAYARIGRQFIQALRECRVGLRTATVEDIQTALRTARGAHIAPATLAQRVAIVRALLTFAYQVGYVRFNAAPLLRLKKLPRRPQRPILTEEEVQRLIAAAAPGRDRLLIAIAYYAGLRVSELASLSWEALQPLPEGQIQLDIVGKGGKARRTLLPTPVAHELMTYRASCHSMFVFPSPVHGGKPLSTRAINDCLKRTARLAGISCQLSLHALRHAHASHALANGAPLSVVSDGLGHSDVRTTAIYLHPPSGSASSTFLKPLK